jgi:hypothetical protein
VADAEDCFDLLVGENGKHPQGMRLRFRVDEALSGRNARDWSANLSDNVHAYAVSQEIEVQDAGEFDVDHSTLSL